MNNNSAKARSAQILRISLSKHEAIQIVSDALGADEKLFFTRHVRERMAERGISDTQVRKVLSQSQMIEEPNQDTQGRWQCRYDGWAAGQGLAVVIGFQFRSDGTTVAVVTTFKTNDYR